MPVSIREQLIAAVQARLGALGVPVVRGPAAADQVPSISIWDHRDSAESRNSTVSVALTLDVEYIAAQTADGTANALLAELISNLTATDPRFGGLADTCRYAGAEIVYPETTGALLAGVRAQFALGYRFKSGDPYTQP